MDLSSVVLPLDLGKRGREALGVSLALYACLIAGLGLFDPWFVLVVPLAAFPMTGILVYRVVQAQRTGPVILDAASVSIPKLGLVLPHSEVLEVEAKPLGMLIVRTRTRQLELFVGGAPFARRVALAIMRRDRSAEQAYRGVP